MKTQGLKFIKIAIALFTLCLAVNPTVNAAENETLNPKIPKGDLLLVQSAHGADLRYNKSTNTYIITLKKVAPFVTYFSERPDRNAGSISIDKFLELWQKPVENNFSANPPNADLHATELMSSKEAINLAVELSDPVYDPKSHTLSYTAKPLNGTTYLPEKAKLHHILLFIDDVCLSCW